MTDTKKKYLIHDFKREISGKIHQLVEADDGVQFYLDPLFLYALEHLNDADLSDKLREMGATQEEVPLILKVLQMAELHSMEECE
jgi:hypothetical protein